MLEVPNGNQIELKPISDLDLKLRGEVCVKNTFKDRQIVFKMKSTNPRLFNSDPIKSLIPPGRTINISVTTSQPVSSDMAREIAQKNKFLIEFLDIDKKVSNLDEAVFLLKGPLVQQIKLYLNTNAIRNSKIGKVGEPSAINSNRLSFHSMAQNPYESTVKEDPVHQSDKLERLKAEVSFLEKKRQSIIKQSNNQIKKPRGNLLKYIFILLIGIAAGNMCSKMTGLNDRISKQLVQPEPVIPEQEGFFSIFNFGSSEEEIIEITPKKPWWKFY